MTDVIFKSRKDNDYCLGKLDLNEKMWKCADENHISNDDNKF
jgi:hypothetical protein